MVVNKLKILKFARGFRGRSGNCINLARRRVYKALQYAYVSRNLKKRDFRKECITRINAGVREHGMKYADFMNGLQQDNISLNRKTLSELAMHEPYSFKALVEQVKFMRGTTSG